MQLTPEERAALERYRLEAYRDGRIGDPEARNVGYLTSSDGWNDRAILANIALREHPADDGESVTNDWLRSVGFAWHGGEQCFVLYFQDADDNPSSLEFYGDRRVTIRGRCVAFCKTRGDVRRLCAALGIQLKETP